MDVSEISDVLAEILDPQTSPIVRAHAQQICENFKESEEAFPTSVWLIDSENGFPINLRHFGLVVLEHFLKTRFGDLKETEKNDMRKKLMALFEACVLDSREKRFVKEKLVDSVVTIAMWLWPQHWLSFSDCFLSWIGDFRNSHKCEFGMIILERLAEEIRTGNGGERQVELQLALSSCAAEVVRQLLELLEHAYVNLAADEIAGRLWNQAAKTLSTFVTWASVPVNQLSRTTALLCEAANVEDLEVSSSTLDLLGALVERPLRPEESVIYEGLFKGFALLRIAFRKFHNGAMTTASHLKKLSLFLSDLGVGYVCHRRWPVFSTNLDQYLDVMIELLKSEVVLISLPVLSFWTVAVKTDSLVNRAEFQQVLFRLLDCCVLKFDASDKGLERIEANAEDFEDSGEFAEAVRLLDSRMLDVIKNITSRLPQKIVKYFDDGLRHVDLKNTLHMDAREICSLQRTYASIAIMVENMCRSLPADLTADTTEALNVLLKDAYMKDAFQITTPKLLLSWMLAARSLVDCLGPKCNTESFILLLQRLFQLLEFSAFSESLPSHQVAQEMCDVRNRACSSIARLSSSCALLFLPHLEAILGKLSLFCAENTTAIRERMLFVEMLLTLALGRSTGDLIEEGMKLKMFGVAIGQVEFVVKDIEKILASPREVFAEAIGVVAIVNSTDMAAEHHAARQKVNLAITMIQLAIKSFVANFEALGEGSVMRDAVKKTIGNFVQISAIIAQHVHRLAEPSLWQAFQADPNLSEELFGIMPVDSEDTSSNTEMNVDMDREANASAVSDNTSGVQRLRVFLSSLRISCYVNLGTATKLPVFYEIPNLDATIMARLFDGTQWFTFAHWSWILKQFVGPLVANMSITSDAKLRDYAIIGQPLVSAVLSFLPSHITEGWNKLAQHNGLSENSDNGECDVKEQLVEDALRNCSTSFVQILFELMLPLSERSSSHMNLRNFDPSEPPPLAPIVASTTSTSNSVGTLVLADDTTGPSVVLAVSTVIRKWPAASSPSTNISKCLQILARWLPELTGDPRYHPWVFESLPYALLEVLGGRLGETVSEQLPQIYLLLVELYRRAAAYDVHSTEDAIVSAYLSVNPGANHNTATMRLREMMMEKAANTKSQRAALQKFLANLSIKPTATIFADQRTIVKSTSEGSALLKRLKGWHKGTSTNEQLEALDGLSGLFGE